MAPNYTLSHDNSYVGLPLPDSGMHPIQIGMYYQQLNDQKKLREQEQQKQKDAHKIAMQKLLGADFEFKDYATATAYDNIINNKIKESLDDIYDSIRKGVDDVDLFTIANKHKNDILNYTIAGKNIKALTDQYTNEIAKREPNLDAAAIGAAMQHKALFNIQNGKSILKKPDEIQYDVHRAYNELMKEKPDLFINGKKGFIDDLNKMKSGKIGGTIGTDSKGRRVNKSYDGQIFPGQKIKFNKYGQAEAVVPDIETAKDGSGNPILVKDKPLAVVSDNVLDQFTSDAAKGYIRVLVNKFAEENKIDVPDDDEAYRLLARHVIIPEIERLPREFITKDVQTNAGSLTRLQLGLTMPGSGKGAADDVNINKVYEKIDAIATQKKNEGKPFTQVNILPLDAQQVVIEAAQKATGGIKNKDILGDEKIVPITHADIYVRKADNGDINIFNARTHEGIGTLTRTGANLQAKQPGVKEKRKVVQQGDKKEAPQTLADKLRQNRK